MSVSLAYKLLLTAFGAFVIGLVILVPQELAAPSTPFLNVSTGAATSSEDNSSVSTRIPTTTQETLTTTSPVVTASADTATTSSGVPHITNPYSFAPSSFDELNTASRAALVNILCSPTNGTINPISGSGVLIDERGVILTNAHVAQYVLLGEHVGISCTIRAGAPARNRYRATVLYMPGTWVNEHGKDILNPKATGTGENDYALLYITSAADGGTLPPVMHASLTYDVREEIVGKSDEVLVASYPAGFLGGVEATFDLHPATTITDIKELYTFTADRIDLVSLGGIILAQGGSSGGAVVNKWGRLIGLVVTSSSGATTAERDLRALTISHVDRSLKLHEGKGLEALLSGDVHAQALSFNAEKATGLRNKFLNALRNR